MADKCNPFGAPVPPRTEPPPDRATMRWPAWMDARYIVTTTTAQYTYNLVANGPGTYQIPGNPLRWGLLISPAPLGAWTLRAGPFRDVNRYGFILPSGGAPQVWTVFNYGPIVTEAWDLQGGAGAECMVCEFVLF